MKGPLRGFRSVGRKVLACVVLASIAALLVTVVALLVYDVRKYREAASNELAVQAQLLGHASAAALQFEDPAFAQANLAVLEGRPTVRAAALYSARGAVFARYLRQGVPAEAIPALPPVEGLTLGDGALSISQRIVRNKEIVGTVYLQADDGSKRRIFGFSAIAFVVALWALLVAVLLSWWLQRGITRPIAHIGAVARQVVESGDYSVRAQRTTNDEIGLVADAMNAMLAETERRTGELERRTAELEASEARFRALSEELESRVEERTAQLEESNRQLEAFSYSVSHDLRAPLRAIDGFGQALLEDYGDQVNEGMRRHLGRIRSATLRMSQLIDDLLSLARISRADVRWEAVDLSAVTRQVLADLAQREPGRVVETTVWDDVVAQGDARLLRVALENLLGNAWKFTSRAEPARIEFGVLRDRETATYFVRDNGAGFDMAHADQLFNAFQRLHTVSEYPGTGIGLATVHRIVHKLGGRIWAHAEPGKGATFYFTLGEPVRQWSPSNEEVA